MSTHDPLQPTTPRLPGEPEDTDPPGTHAPSHPIEDPPPEEAPQASVDEPPHEFEPEVPRPPG